LPYPLNAAFAAGGIAQAFLIGQPDLPDAFLGAIFGFAILSTGAILFRWARGIDGLGFGDQKFAAAAGFWIGWQQIVPMLLIASGCALAFILVKFMLTGKFNREARLPFGPFLALGTAVCWVTQLAV
jgi:leader peptidase (prepilin peptidase)/N-methyltransferase